MPSLTEKQTNAVRALITKLRNSNQCRKYTEVKVYHDVDDDCFTINDYDNYTVYNCASGLVLETAALWDENPLFVEDDGSGYQLNWYNDEDSWEIEVRHVKEPVFQEIVGLVQTENELPDFENRHREHDYWFDYILHVDTSLLPRELQDRIISDIQACSPKAFTEEALQNMFRSPVTSPKPIEQLNDMGVSFETFADIYEHLLKVDSEKGLRKLATFAGD